MKKIILAHDHKFKEFGGAYYSGASLSYGLLNIYKMFGDELLVLSRSERVSSVNKKMALSSGENISFCTLPNMRSFKGLLNIKRNYNEIKRVTADATLIVIKLPSFVGLLTFISNYSRRDKIVIEVIGNAFEANYLHGSVSGKFFAGIEHLLTKLAIRSAGNVVYITSKYLQRIYPTFKNSVVCSNAIVIPVEKETLLLRAQRVRSDVIKIGLIGSLDVGYKGHETAIQVIRYLKVIAPGKHWELHFVGGGDRSRWDAQLEKISLEHNVVFRGGLKSGQDVFSFIDSMDFMLQPSTVEAQGRCILEAMSRGCPVLSTNVGGIPELLDSEVLFERHDYKSMANKIIELSNESERYIGLSSSQWLRSHDFTFEKVTRIRSDFFSNIIDRK